MILSATSVSASVVDDAKASINAAQTPQDYQAVLTKLQNELKRKPKPNTAIDLKYWAGVACFHLDRYDEAAEYFEAATSRHADAYRYLGKISFADYDFESALEAYDDYQEALKKAKKSRSRYGQFCTVDARPRGKHCGHRQHKRALRKVFLPLSRGSLCRTTPFAR